MFGLSKHPLNENIFYDTSNLSAGKDTIKGLLGMVNLFLISTLSLGNVWKKSHKATKYIE